MALNQLPVIEATLQVVHSGPTAGESFATTLDASDGAPMAPTQTYTFDLNVFAPDLIDVIPQVEVYRVDTGARVEVDVKVESELVTLTFFQAVEPADYRAKVMG